MIEEADFYGNDVLPANDAAVVLPSSQSAIPRPSLVIRSVASIVVAGVMTFGPFAVSTEQTPATVPYQNTVTVHVNAAGIVPVVELTPAHRAAAQRFRQFAKAVPQSEVEKLPDPDFGL